jgi:hypothetical protein
MDRWLRIGLAFVVVAVLAGWYWQSRLIGAGSQWYLRFVAAREQRSGEVSQRRDAVRRIHRLILIAPPDERWVGELFDLMTALTTRVSTGEINLNWASYVYTSYLRDLVRDRPSGEPRRSVEEIDASLADYIRFYSLRKRPDETAPGDVFRGVPDESYTVEEIERAAREGRDPSVP